jgi:nucleoside-diphosphate-sugar epimerase
MREPDSSFWRDKTVLVTGSTGFAGGHLSQYLHKLGANVRCFARSEHNAPVRGPRSKVVVGDVQDYQSLLEALREVDIAFHLAATTLIPETRAKIFGTFSTNSLGTLNFLMAARERKVKKLVYVSTCHVYGKQERMPITEDAPPHPIDIYSASKLAGESLALSFAEMEGMDISISRAFNHYGPGQRPEFLIPSIILRLLKEQILEMGNPAPTRDCTYVDDIVRGYALLGELGKSSEIYHFSSGEERSVREIVDTIVNLSSTKPVIRWNPDARRVDISRSLGDYSKARKTLGWSPRIPFEEGVKTTIGWYRSHQNTEA